MRYFINTFAAACAAASVTTSPAFALSSAGTSVTGVTLSSDGGCVAANPTTFSVSYLVAGDTDDLSGDDYFSVFLVDSKNQILSAEIRAAPSSGGGSASIGMSTDADPAPGPFTAHIVDETAAATSQSTGATFNLTPISSLQFDPNALDPDCLAAAATQESTETSETLTATEQGASARAGAVLSQIPRFSTRLQGGGTGGSFTANANPDVGVFSFAANVGATEQAQRGWVMANYTYVDGDVDTNIGFLQGGIDWRYDERTLFGLFGRFDLSEQAGSATADSSTRGFLIGPYATHQLANGIYLEGLLAFGQVDTDLTLSTGATANFDSDRYLASFGVTGSTFYGGYELRPNAQLAHYVEIADGFTDSVGGTQARQRSETSQVRLGSEIVVPALFMNMAAEWRFGAQGVYTDTSFGADANEVVRGQDGLSLSLSGNLDVDVRHGSIAFGTFIDGLGTPGYMAYTLTAQYTVRF